MLVMFVKILNNHASNKKKKRKYNHLPKMKIDNHEKNLMRTLYAYEISKGLVSIL